VALHEASLRVGKVESSLSEADAHPFNFVYFISSSSSELQKTLSWADDAKRAAEEMKAATKSWVRELSLARNGAVAASVKASATLFERSAELQGFRLVVDQV
jgi:hypothetical protein